MQLLRPSRELLPGYVDALERGWSANSERGREAALEELAQIAADPDGFLALMEDREGRGPPIKLPDGSLVPRLPGIRRWMWDEGFAGSIALRWQPGGPQLPPYCLGHIGYGVVPWRQGRGHATAALVAMLEEARMLGLPYVEITTDPDNPASQRVIAKAGGVLHERFLKPASFARRDCLRYRIRL